MKREEKEKGQEADVEQEGAGDRVGNLRYFLSAFSFAKTARSCKENKRVIAQKVRLLISSLQYSA